jgi:16S rRNA (guanine1516-N2)-methyltransferase
MIQQPTNITSEYRPMEKTSLCVVCSDQTKHEQADNFSSTHNLPLYSEKNPDFALQLHFRSDHIELYDSELATSIHVDFVSGALAHREQFGGGKGQAIAKAIGLKKFDRPTVIDASAGLARDAYVLATLGCQLTLIERSPVLYCMLRDGIERALLLADQDRAIHNFTNLVYANTRLYLEHMDPDSKPDVIYFDPMYPERKKSALVKKDMQILHKLIGANDDESELLEVALQYAKHRVVVKRPIHAEPLSGKKPTMAITSKKTRYDVYVVT